MSFYAGKNCVPESQSALPGSCLSAVGVCGCARLFKHMLYCGSSLIFHVFIPR